MDAGAIRGSSKVRSLIVIEPPSHLDLQEALVERARSVVSELFERGGELQQQREGPASELERFLGHVLDGILKVVVRICPPFDKVAAQLKDRHLIEASEWKAHHGLAAR